MHIAPVTLPAIDPLASLRVEPPATRGVWPAWLRTMLDRSAERRQLLALEERDLRDIGLAPSEALALAQLPLWHR
jgi:uncharacterized protein YjiS (DUF1127 family)